MVLVAEDPVEDDPEDAVGFMYSARVLPVLFITFSVPLPTRDKVHVDQPLETRLDERVTHDSVVPEAVLVTGVSCDSASTGTTKPSPL